MRIGPDFGFVYFLPAKSSRGLGLRFSTSEVAVIQGQGDDPSAYQATEFHQLPVHADDPTGDLFDAIQEVIYNHPEVADLLGGKISIRTLER